VTTDDQAAWGGPPPSGDRGDESPHDEVGAYVLNALPAAERRAFEVHLRTCPAGQREVAELQPVARLLPRLFELEPSVAVGIWSSEADVPAASADLRGRILEAVRADLGASQDRQPATGGGAAGYGGPAEPDAWHVGPHVADERAFVAPAPMPERRTRLVAAGHRFGGGWPVAAALALVAVGVTVWALLMRGQVADQAAEISTQRAQLAQLRQANASAYALGPTADGPSGAAGHLLYDVPDGLAMLHVEGLPPLAKGHTYQLWLLQDGKPLPGKTFAVDTDGAASMAMTADLRTIDQVALTVEPDGGSTAPTSAPMMIGAIGTRTD
jgi:anti-sigma-K factor RskA